ncbi:MAG: putative metal-dependent hydrolase [Saprospiraceae bacterium]|nr:putative metal-dependent hydrolase [Saprospiraceae bacterium]
MMTEVLHETKRFPIGKFKIRHDYSPSEIASNIHAIRTFPEKLEEFIPTLDPSSLLLPYREGGWTGKQVVHHLADSHMNAYIRIKWALTEDVPTIKTYFENLWAETPEVSSADIGVSIGLLKFLHDKWSTLLGALDERQLNRAVFHPEMKKEINISQFIALYAWHGEHHLGHLRLLKDL